MKIENAELKIIKDSRGKDTLSADLYGQTIDLHSQASVPSGKSKGMHEAFVLEPKLALEKFEQIKHQILASDFNSQEKFDHFLISLDGTTNKSNLGANLILALSLAFARLKAKSEGKELFIYIRNLIESKGCVMHDFKLPRPIFNIINGGAHSQRSDSQLEFQEFQVIPDIDDFVLGFSIAKEFYRKLGEYLIEKFGKDKVFLGDEAGYSAPFQNNEEALDIIFDFINDHNYPLNIGLDVAASQFFRDGFYKLSDKQYSAEELKKYYLDLISRYNIISLEDPFEEEDFNSFSSLLKELQFKNIRVLEINRQYFGDRISQILIITDDLTTTNSNRLKTAIDKKSGNTILIKPNQIGTLTETLNVIKIAYDNTWKIIVSHRSGETMDNFIADLAVGVGAWGLKAGAPGAPERLAKYERLLEIRQKI